ncbi:MAG TPA: FAD-dependent oxidoreductase [Candidatus Paceibacterota bacterium]
MDSYQARLIQKTALTPTVLLARFALNNDQKFVFQSGQYILVDFTLPDGQIVQRPFSIASSPHKQNEVELLIRLLPTGIVSDFFRNINLGTQINFSGPKGKLVLQSETQPAHFITSGVGIAPFRSMLHDLLFVRKTTAPVQLSFVRDSDPWIAFDDELALWMEKCKNFVYSNIRPPADKVDIGAVWENVALEDSKNTHIYMAGAPNFIAEGKIWLAKQGVPAESIFTEN